MEELTIRDLVDELYGKGTSHVYQVLLQLESLSSASDELYPFCDEFLQMLHSNKNVVRLRGFRLLCRQAKWDKQDKLNRSWQAMSDVLQQAKPTELRQYLCALEQVALYKQSMRQLLRAQLLCLDLSGYKESMLGLIEKDISRLLDILDAADGMQ